MGERRITVGNVLGTVLVLLVALTCVRLGIWQLDRLQQRRTLNERIVARGEQSPITFPAALSDTLDSHFRTADLTGEYDVARSIVLPGRSLRGAPGVHLLTPFVVAPDTAVLVNRGWVPAADAATIEPDSFPASDVRVSGLVIPFPVGGRGSAARADSFRVVWYAPDHVALQAQFPYTLLPVALQLLPQEGLRGYPRRLDPPALDQGPHLGYAIQWFGFAAIAIIGWIALWLRSRRARDRTIAPEPQPWP